MSTLITRPTARHGGRDASSLVSRSTALALMVPALMFVAGGDTDARITRVRS